MKSLDRAPKWDKNRAQFLKIGLICSLLFVLTAFNYTSYTSKINYVLDTEPPLEELEVIPPRTRVKKSLPPPSKYIKEIPNLEEVKQDIEFVESELEQTSEENVSEVVPPTIQKNIAIPPAVEIKAQEDSNEGPLLFAERMPVYKSCGIVDDEQKMRKCTENKLVKHIYSNLKYPTIARENNITGVVVVSFVVNRDGKVEDINIMKDIGGGCGQAVENVITTLGDFFPGKQNGRPVSVIYRIPVNFELK